MWYNQSNIIERKFNMTYKEEFIKFMVDSGVLTFGDFTLKSG